MTKLVIVLIVLAMVLFPLGLFEGYPAIAAAGAVCLGSGALIAEVIDMRRKRNKDAVG